MDSLKVVAEGWGIPIWLFVVVLVWSVIWKGFALWKSAKKNQLFWFILILVTNSMGIIEILYLFLFSKLDFSKSKKKEKNANKIQKASIGKNSKKS